MKALQRLWDGEWKFLEEAETAPGYRYLAKSRKGHDTIRRNDAFRQFWEAAEYKNDDLYETAKIWQVGCLANAQTALEDEWQQTQAVLAGAPEIQQPEPDQSWKNNP